MEHTPLKIDLSIVRDSKGNVLACCAGKEVAAEIVQAVNSHEALVEALMVAETVLSDIFNRESKSSFHGQRVRADISDNIELIRATLAGVKP